MRSDRDRAMGYFFFGLVAVQKLAAA